MHQAVTDMRITVDMHERKATMHRISDAYITLPGGFGTMEEFFRQSRGATGSASEADCHCECARHF